MTAHLRHLLAATHLDAEGRAVVYADRLDAAIVATEAEEERLLGDLARARGRSVAQTRWDALGSVGSGDYLPAPAGRSATPTAPAPSPVTTGNTPSPGGH